MTDTHIFYARRSGKRLDMAKRSVALWLSPRKERMTDHDDTPSTEERERADREVFECYERENGSGLTLHDIRVSDRIQRNRLAARCASAEAEVERLARMLDGLERTNADNAEMALAARALAPAVAGGLVEMQRRHEAELAALRSQAALAPLPSGWQAQQLVGSPSLRGAMHGRIDIWYDSREDTVQVDEGCARMSRVPAAVLRHLLALPPQEDVRGAIAERVKVCRRAIAESLAEEARMIDEDPAEHDTAEGFLGAANLVLESGCVGRALWALAAAPRTEGGGDHGE